MRLALRLLYSAILCTAAPVSAQPLRVDITEGERAPLKISLAATQSHAGAAGGTAEPAMDLLTVIETDLASTALYNLARHAVVPAPSLDAELTAARSRASQGLVWFTTAISEGGNLRAECSYIDVYSGGVEASAAFTVPAGQQRRAAHKCADLVYTHTSGDPGHFDTQFALITDHGTPLAPQRRVTIIDSDGFNPRMVSDPAAQAAMPVLSRDGNAAAYIAIERHATFLVVLDRVSGQQKRIEAQGALPSAPAFSPDGRSLLLTVSREGNADIVRYDLATGRFIPLTNAFGSDTAASYSPDGSRIVFQSNRSGQSQLYTMQADGSDQQRLSFDEGSFATPSWSPRGDRIAFTFITSSGMQIGTMRSDGSGVRLLPATGQDESPTWAASGTLLAFTRTPPAGTAQLWITDLAGKRQRQLSMPVAASEASWSGLLP